MRRYVIGIDEVGRGSLAGPVVVAAVAVPQGVRLYNYFLGKLRDSKKLTPASRERWFNYFRSHPKIKFDLAWVYPRQIEKINIARAANLAAWRAFNRLVCRYGLSLRLCRIFLDGGLFLGNRKKRDVGVKAKTVVRGDGRIPAVKAASIVAKVSRDRAMKRLAKIYPVYGFGFHKGYGTKKHFAAIKKHGPSEVHRLTFLRFS